MFQMPKNQTSYSLDFQSHWPISQSSKTLAHTMFGKPITQHMLLFTRAAKLFQTFWNWKLFGFCREKTHLIHNWLLKSKIDSNKKISTWMISNSLIKVVQNKLFGLFFKANLNFYYYSIKYISFFINRDLV